MRTTDDRSTRARIRDAAITCIAEDGVAATTARGVATKAAVSPGSVIHHFGSMDGLRTACDAHVVAVIRAQKVDAMQQGPALDPLAALRTAGDGPPVLAYLARTLTDGSPHVTELLAEMVDDAVAYMATGIENGILQPVDDLRGVATVLVIWSLGAVVLHEQVHALLGVDLLTLSADPAGAAGYLLPALEIMGGGLLTEAAARHLASTMPTPDEHRSAR